MVRYLTSIFSGLKIGFKKKSNPRQYTSVEIKKVFYEYLRTHNTMSIATSQDNQPWAASVFYANDDIILYFISNAIRARHSKNIAVNNRVAVTINEDYKLKKFDDWKKIKGIQLEGYAYLIDDKEELTKAVSTYIKKYPFTSIYLKQLFKTPKLTLFERLIIKLPFFPKFRATEANRFYKIVPTRIWFVDNERSFEKRLEVPID